MSQKYNELQNFGDVHLGYTFEKTSSNFNSVKGYCSQELHAIKNSEKARKGRTDSQIESDVMLGAWPEYMLIQDFGMNENHKKYHDLIFNGTEVEVKATKCKWKNSLCETVVDRSAVYNSSEIYMFFEQTGNVYELVKILKVQ